MIYICEVTSLNNGSEGYGADRNLTPQHAMQDARQYHSEYYMANKYKLESELSPAKPTEIGGFKALCFNL